MTRDNNCNPPPFPSAARLLGEMVSGRVVPANAPLVPSERATRDQEAQSSSARDMSEGRSGLEVERRQNTQRSKEKKEVQPRGKSEVNKK